jgi:uncharacterized protein YajQ (UPF0234 family)
MEPLMPSFDVVNKLDLQLIDDAINDSNRTISQRYDFRGVEIILELNKKEKTLKVQVPDDMKLQAVREIVIGALTRKGLSPKVVDWGKREEATLGAIRLNCKLVEGIDKEQVKKINTLIKDSGLKVKTVNQGDQVRVEAKSIDDLQAVIALLKEADLPTPLQFVNMKR